MTQWLLEHWLVWTLLLVYAAVLVAHALAGRRAATRGLSGYYVGSRGMGGFVIGVSFFATFASTNSYIGHAGKGYEYGLPWLTMAVFIVLFTGLSWVVVAPRLRQFASYWDALTLPDLLSARFSAPGSRRLRTYAGLVILFSSLLYVIAIFKGAGALFQHFLDIPYEAAVGVTLLIVMLYTSVGGFVSVVRTDVLQGALMLLGSVTIFYFVTSAAGGVGSIAQLVDSPSTSFVFDLNGGLPFAVLLGVALSGSLKLLVDPRQVSRFYALRDAAAVKRGIWIAVVGIAVIQFCLFPVGVYAHLLLDGVADTDQIVPMLINNAAVFPVWVADCLVIAIVAAAMSSMDSVLLVAGSVLYKDLLEPFDRRGRALRWTRSGIVGVAVLAAVLALNPPAGIVEITIFSGSLYAVCFLPAILFGLHWLRGSERAVIASMTAGIVVLVGWLLAGGNAYLHEVFPALAVSVAVYVWQSTSTPPVLDRWPAGLAEGAQADGASTTETV